MENKIWIWSILVENSVAESGSDFDCWEERVNKYFFHWIKTEVPHEIPVYNMHGIRLNGIYRDNLYWEIPNDCIQREAAMMNLSKKMS